MSLRRRFVPAGNANCFNGKSPCTAERSWPPRLIMCLRWNPRVRKKRRSAGISSLKPTGARCLSFARIFCKLRFAASFSHTKRRGRTTYRRNVSASLAFALLPWLPARPGWSRSSMRARHWSAATGYSSLLTQAFWKDRTKYFPPHGAPANRAKAARYWISCHLPETAKVDPVCISLRCVWFEFGDSSFLEPSFAH